MVKLQARAPLAQLLELKQTDLVADDGWLRHIVRRSQLTLTLTPATNVLICLVDFHWV
jgi:hypothetical protein